MPTDVKVTIFEDNPIMLDAYKAILKWYRRLHLCRLV